MSRLKNWYKCILYESRIDQNPKCIHEFILKWCVLT